MNCFSSSRKFCFVFHLHIYYQTFYIWKALAVAIKNTEYIFMNRQCNEIKRKNGKMKFGFFIWKLSKSSLCNAVVSILRSNNSKVYKNRYYIMKQIQ